MASNLFPVKPALSSHWDVLHYNEQNYLQGVRDGRFVPFVYPMCTFGLGLLILYFLIPPTSRLHSRLTRYLVFAITATWHVYMIRNCKAHSPSVGFGIGITSAWGVLWAAVTLVFTDAKRDWKRVKREEVPATSDAPPKQNGTQDPTRLNGVAVRQRRVFVSATDERLQPVHHATAAVSNGRKITYRWQAYPLFSMRDRLEWVLDFLSNFRGVGWNWRPSTSLPSRPPIVEASLNADKPGSPPAEDKRVSRAGVARYDTLWACMLHNSWLSFKGYVLIDLLKTIMNHDPYFWGLVDKPPPAWLPYFIQSSAFWTRGYRLLVSMCVVWTGLRTIYCWAPLIFAGLLGTAFLGANGETWMYPDHFGSYSQVFERGLTGWWGGWWHQIFRFAFQAAGKWVSKDVLRLKGKSSADGVVQLFVAFIISGLLHASGSLTTMGETFPWSSSFTFFLVQPIGILLETGWRSFLKKRGLQGRAPRELGLVVNFVWVHAWFCLTGPLLTDDFARGGIWLFEPVMLSPLRGLGFGVEGDGFFCWTGRYIVWHTDERWWLSGLAL